MSDLTLIGIAGVLTALSCALLAWCTIDNMKRIKRIEEKITLILWLGDLERGHDRPHA